ncbi:alpha/beta hydrolase [Aromatoleum diolicum]|uniref:Alpha/beta fold hydrolase n=1 Tax=Aromatoleum diolicum TaxID=75796 RepID=A0ABX1QII8_9RHOO|nr:alpha/beta fold hydrolase [Aromatoleum diolicum]NMG77297.1 alpha/beta fold hydrolase [Aromatoleum diolicum]
MLLSATALALAGLRVAAHHAIRVSLAAPRIRETETPAALGLAFEAVRIPTANAKQLHGWLIPADTAGPAPVVLVLHGWGGNAQMMLPLARPLHRAGFAALFIDARCHGLSDADSFASLPRFAEDASHACDWLAARADIDPRRIALLGHSVGAGAVLLAAARRGDAVAVVSISAFAHPADMMRRWLAGKRIPAVPARYLLGHIQRVIGHPFDDIAPLRSITRLRCPVLLVHGAQDTIVPPTDARRLHAAGNAGAVELLMLSGDHESFAETERELAAVVDFLRRAAAGAVIDAIQPESRVVT